MNSKEFVNKLIVFSKEQINYYENKIVEDEKYPSLQQCHQEELKSAQEGFNHFLKIKQDLDRLEQLEKENQELKKELKRCQDTIKKWTDNHSKLIIENGKMKKALGILKEKVYLKVKKYCKEDYENPYKLEVEMDYSYDLTREEYELLKSVLEEE